ncbi:MAG: hypothetical protein H0V82_04880 [Candidatus Protochlamydia sp.]|nr:hypothetical protein [Candidatus Protochlamydia sp.]
MDTNNHFFSSIIQSQINWEHLNNERKIITGFLKSLNADLIGKGLVYTDQFKLNPRSSYFNSTKIQWITTINVPTATFDDTLNIFIQLITKTDELKKRLNSFKPHAKEDCSQDSLYFFFKLINMKSIIKLSAEKGLQQLSGNYLLLGDNVKSNSLNEIGSELFIKINTLFDSFYNKLLPYFPDLKIDLDLEKYGLKGRNLISKRNEYCSQARTVGWATDKGVCIPRLMLIDSRKNVSKESQFNKTAIKSVAEFMKLPFKAIAVPAQNGSVEWVPIRPEITNNNQITFEQGVVGTCERVHHKTLHLCNLYYKIEASNKKITICTGAVDTPLKGKELIKLLLELPVKNEIKNNRWVLHQLNSITNEKEIVQNVQTQISEIESIPNKEKIGFCLMHVNTAYNVASQEPSEDLAVTEINIYALAQMAEMVCIEISSFLKEANFNFKTEEWKKFFLICTGISIFSKTSKYESFVEEQVVDKEFKDISIKPHSERRIDSIMPNVQNIRINAVQSSPELSIENNLDNQIKLQDQLKELRTRIKNLIKALLTYKVLNYSVSCFYDRAILILQTYEHLIALQLKLEGAPALSRTSEIELFLMLYRFMNINTIISCDGGLDRTAAIAAIDDTLSQMQKELYKGKFDQILATRIIRETQNILTGDFKEKYNEMERNLTQKDKEIIEFTSINEINQSIFDLIINLDESREMIFKLINDLPENVCFFSNSNEVDFDKIEMDFKNKDIKGFRQKIINKIDLQDQEKAILLKNSLQYMEIFAAHLLGSQQEKIFYSTGVFGFKYQYNNGWVKNVSANPYPLDRLPPFIFTEEDTPIPLFTYTKHWMSTSIRLTKLAEMLIFRLSKLRGS